MGKSMPAFLMINPPYNHILLRVLESFKDFLKTVSEKSLLFSGARKCDTIWLKSHVFIIRHEVTITSGKKENMQW